MTRSYEYRSSAQSFHSAVYKKYMDELRLDSHHHTDLMRRKLTPEQIMSAGYKSKKQNNSRSAQDTLMQIEKHFEGKLDGVPGFFTNDKTQQRTVLSAEGLVIPCRDIDGDISSLVIRPDNPKTDKLERISGKYVHFSSSHKTNGGKVSLGTHLPIIRGLARKVCGVTVRITEGILKADVATALDPEIYCLGMHGLKHQEDLLAVLEALEIFELRIALDAGEDDNEDMIAAKVRLIKLAEEFGINVFLEVWDPEYGKGIDDVLASGNGDKIRFATPEEIQSLQARTDRFKPHILVVGGGLSDEATEGEKALIAAGLPVYQRGKNLVTPATQQVEASDGRQTKIAVVHPVSKARMVDYLCGVAKWKKENDRGEPYFVNPPAYVADTILNRFGIWTFPPLAGVIMTPTLRSDGSLLKDIGYDPITRLYLLSCPPMPPMPEEPTREDALAALAVLEEPLIDFPFVNEASRSVALSAIMTPILRGAFKAVPMHVISATMPGSGKSYLLDTVSGVALGQRCPAIAAGRTEEETEKRLGASLLEGRALISIDNLNGDLEGDALCQMIERPSVSVRILGKSEQVTIESRSTFFANGNNIRLRGDITRRAVQCRLDANSERPELRTFRLDPFKMVLEDRGKYIAAILTIARAYILAGKPNTATPRLASFEEWSDLVRSSLMWLGKEDPLSSMESSRAEDPTLQTISEVFATLWEVTEGNRYTAQKIIALALETEPVSMNDGSDYKYPALREALINAVGDQRGFLTPKRLGQWFSRHKGRISNDLRLEGMADKHGHAAVWWLEKAV